MKPVKVDSIFELKMHEVTKIDPMVAVMRVHKGFIYMYFKSEGTRQIVSDTEFVPCERFIPDNKTVYKFCKYFNDGNQKEFEYNWLVEDAGVRCEYYHEFFHVVDETITPNCNVCKIYESRPQPRKGPRVIN